MHALFWYEPNPGHCFLLACGYTSIIAGILFDKQSWTPFVSVCAYLNVFVCEQTHMLCATVPDS